jgi:hypothetical protein
VLTPTEALEVVDKSLHAVINGAEGRGCRRHHLAAQEFLAGVREGVADLVN